MRGLCLSGVLPIRMELRKGTGDVPKMSRHGEIFASEGRVRGMSRRSLHSVVFKNAREKWALGGYPPIGNGLRYQKMKKSVVCRRDCPPKAGLARPLGLTLGQMKRLFEQIVRERHPSYPRGFRKNG